QGSRKKLFWAVEAPAAGSTTVQSRRWKPVPRCSGGAAARSRLGESMKYLCLAYEEESKLNSLSKSEWDALRRDTLDYVDKIRKSGHLIVTHALQSVQTATTVRVRHNKVSTTDG